MGVRLKNVDEIVTSGGQTLDVTAAVAAASGGSGGNSVSYVASGSVSTGDILGLRSDGKIEVVKESINAQTTNLDSTHYANSAANIKSVTMLPLQNKCVVVYRDNNSGDTKYMVGTISGGTITFGSEGTFHNKDMSHFRAVYNPNDGTIIYHYLDLFSNNAGIVIGSVSGDVMTLGARSVYYSSNQMNYFEMCYDATAGLGVVTWNQMNVSGESYWSKARAFNISGTSVTGWGTAETIMTGTNEGVACAYDPTSGKTVLFNNKDGTTYGRTATFSGNNITLNSAANANLSFAMPIKAYSSSNNGILITGRNLYNGSMQSSVGTINDLTVSFGPRADYGKNILVGDYADNIGGYVLGTAVDGSNNSNIRVGTVSGNSISYGDPVAVLSGTPSIGEIDYDPNSGKLLYAYHDASDVVNVGILTAEGNALSSNAESYIGIAGNNAADGESVDVIVTGVAQTNSTALTPKTEYYVGKNGTYESSDSGYQTIGKAYTTSLILLS